MLSSRSLNDRKFLRQIPKGTSDLYYLVVVFPTKFRRKYAADAKYPAITELLNMDTARPKLPNAIALIAVSAA